MDRDKSKRQQGIVTPKRAVLRTRKKNGMRIRKDNGIPPDPAGAQMIKDARMAKLKRSVEK